MKAQQEILTPLLITGILIIVIGSVYLWGIPLIQKNSDITILKRSEDFVRTLNEKIKNVANTESRDTMKIDFGMLTFEPDPDSEYTTGKLRFDVETKGTIYAIGTRIPFVRNETCHETGSCELGKHETEWFFVESNEIEGNYLTSYFLTYRDLKKPGSGDVYKINLTGELSKGGQDHEIIIEYTGTRSEDPTVTNIDIRII